MNDEDTAVKGTYFLRPPLLRSASSKWKEGLVSGRRHGVKGLQGVLATVPIKVRGQSRQRPGED